MEILDKYFFIGLGLTGLVRLGVATYVDVDVDIKVKLRELDKYGHR